MIGLKELQNIFGSNLPRTEGQLKLFLRQGIFSKEEFLEMVNVVNLEIGKMV